MINHRIKNKKSSSEVVYFINVYDLFDEIYVALIRLTKR